ncbi:MAG: biotin/lipoate A/B protein ligase family protein [Petrimonas sp.]|jgi:lipoate-protein ligase A|uniref:Lipoate-protein ligase LplJ n=1 Tax=bioreactor metagenome TaxID=1076179 RepID=A0A644XR95_9ZZZZ|nr:biotin/lipoate A/B protein ligase family protein [Petrimonas sp.]NLU30227.1 lipoate--protein ligase family protein [Bacteroidales bacterium]HAC72123.1 lipoate--protein ligase family protein [Porphyromonadaceae bacterium]MDD2910084.1 biotin/lipoate A/B protein ligase family protein [Petrimonas sp.]MDD4535944.1 biotin/lipoate A/B protein ligase family protein [Petrimonas sp.]
MTFVSPLMLDKFNLNTKLIFSPSTVPAFNLAAEEYLFSVREDYLFLYVNNASVIVGYNQAVVNEVDMDFCIEKDIRIIRRLSGGGAVYHDSGNLNYAFISDKKEMPLSADFLLPVIHVLQQLNIPVETGKRKDLWLPGGYKVSGTASHVSKGRELHHGTLLYESNLEHLKRSLSPEKRNLITKATASVPSPVKNISSFLKEEKRNPFSFREFVKRFVDESMKYFNIAGLTSFSPAEVEAIETLQREKYSQRTWNYKM